MLNLKSMSIAVAAFSMLASCGNVKQVKNNFPNQAEVNQALNISNDTSWEATNISCSKPEKLAKGVFCEYTLTEKATDGSKLSENTMKAMFVKDNGRWVANL